VQKKNRLTGRDRLASGSQGRRPPKLAQDSHPTCVTDSQNSCCGRQPGSVETKRQGGLRRRPADSAFAGCWRFHRSKNVAHPLSCLTLSSHFRVMTLATEQGDKERRTQFGGRRTRGEDRADRVSHVDGLSGVLPNRSLFIVRSPTSGSPPTDRTKGPWMPCGRGRRLADLLAPGPFPTAPHSHGIFSSGRALPRRARRRTARIEGRSHEPRCIVYPGRHPGTAVHFPNKSRLSPSRIRAGLRTAAGREERLTSGLGRGRGIAVPTLPCDVRWTVPAATCRSGPRFL